MTACRVALAHQQGTCTETALKRYHLGLKGSGRPVFCHRLAQFKPPILAQNKTAYFRLLLFRRKKAVRSWVDITGFKPRATL